MVGIVRRLLEFVVKYSRVIRSVPHPLHPPVEIVWLREQNAELIANAARWREECLRLRQKYEPNGAPF